MLVLSRKEDEEIVIGDGLDAIVIRVVRIGPDSVKLGIEAPTKVPIHRREIWERIQEEMGK